MCPKQERKEKNAIAKSTHKGKDRDNVTKFMPDGINPKVIAAAVAAAVQAWGKLKWFPTALSRPWWLAARSAILGLFVG